MTRTTRSSGAKSEVNLWNLGELRKTRPAAKKSLLLEKKYTLKIPARVREKDLWALRRAAKEHEEAIAAESATSLLHEITGMPTTRFPTPTNTDTAQVKVVSSLGVAFVMASMRDGEPDNALDVEGDSGSSGSSTGGGSVAISLNATTAGGSAADGGGGGGASSGGGVHSSNNSVGRAEPEGSLEGSSRGSYKRALDGARQGGDSFPQQSVGEERARKRSRLGSPGAGGGAGGGRALGGRGGGAGGRAAGTRSNNSNKNGGKTTLSCATTRATRKSGIKPMIDLWDLEDLPKSSAAAKRAPSPKAYMYTGERPQQERNDGVPVLGGGAAMEQDQQTARIPIPESLLSGNPPSIAGFVSSSQEKAAVSPPLVSTLDGENSDATTGEGDSGSGSGSSSDGSWGASGRSATTGGSIPRMVHTEDSVLTDPEDDKDNDHAKVMASPGQKEGDKSSKQGVEAGGAVGSFGDLAAAAAWLNSR